MLYDLFFVIFIASLLFVFLLAINHAGKRYSVHPELQRKLLHVGLGITSCLFPWIFQHAWQVYLLCTIIFGVLLLVRINPALHQIAGGSLHKVQRQSAGELLFAISVTLLFTFYTSPALYILPLMILTLSDTAAALVGVKFGKHVFRIVDGTKSCEGAFAFCCVTFFVTLTVLFATTPLPWYHVCVLAVLLAVLGSLTEVVAWRGLDNLFIPIGTFLLLLNLFSQPFINSVGLLLFFLLVAVAVFYLASYSSLNIHALLVTVITGCIMYESGGWQWVLPPAIVFLMHIILSTLQNSHNEDSIASIVCIAISGFVWIIAEQYYQVYESFFLFTLTMAIHLQIIILLRIKTQRNKCSEPWLVSIVSFLSGWLMLPPLLIYYPETVSSLSPMMICGLLLMQGGGIALHIKSHRFSTLRWLEQAFFAFVGSLLCLGIIRMILS